MLQSHEAGCMNQNFLLKVFHSESWKSLSTKNKELLVEQRNKVTFKNPSINVTNVVFGKRTTGNHFCKFEYWK